MFICISDVEIWLLKEQGIGANLHKIVVFKSA